MPQHKQAKIEDTQSFISTAPVFKQDIATPTKVISSTLDEDTCKVAPAAGVVKKAAVSQDSSGLAPTAIPESQTSSPGEQKPQNNVGANSGNPPPLIKVETEDGPMINTKV